MFTRNHGARSCCREACGRAGKWRRLRLPRQKAEPTLALSHRARCGLRGGLMLMVAALTLLAVVALGGKATAAPAQTSTDTTMKIIKTSVADDGLVHWKGGPADALELARAYGVHSDTLALARTVQSEVLPNHPDIARIAIAHAVLNYARRKKITVTELVADDDSAYEGEHGRGRYGRQWRRGRYCSTANDPSLSTLRLCEEIRTGKIKDPTGGAIQWDSPRSQGAQPGTTKTADEVAESRIADGKEKVLLDGIPERDLRLWRYA